MAREPSEIAAQVVERLNEARRKLEEEEDPDNPYGPGSYFRDVEGSIKDLAEAVKLLSESK